MLVMNVVRLSHTYDFEFDVHFYNIHYDDGTSELFYTTKEMLNRLKQLLCYVEKEVPAAVVLGDITKSPAVE